MPESKNLYFLLLLAVLTHLYCIYCISDESTIVFVTRKKLQNGNKLQRSSSRQCKTMKKCVYIYSPCKCANVAQVAMEMKSLYLVK